MLSPAGIGGACQIGSADQHVSAILDGNLTSKHLNFGNMGGPTVYSFVKGVGTGFVVMSQNGSRSSIIQAFQFGTANDVPSRDPLVITIEGSSTDNITTQLMGSSWDLIYYGSTGINATSDPGRSVYGTLQTVTSPMSYVAYRILIVAQRAFENSVQYSEFRLFGYFTN